jgi:protein SCO1/2
MKNIQHGLLLLVSISGPILTTVGASAALCLGVQTAQAADSPMDPHAHHHHVAKTASTTPTTTIKTADYKVPSIKLVRADGRGVDLATELSDPRAVLMNFIFTSCTTICPVMSHVFTDVQQKLGADSEKLHMVSISIDPEHDTPARLKDYAARYGAGAQWNFYTGTAANSIAAQKAFAAFRGDKMNHEPLTLFRKAPGQPWLRIEGLATAEDLVGHYRTLMAAR